MVVQLGWFYQTKYGSAVRIEKVEHDVNNFFAIVVSGRTLDPCGCHVITSDGRDREIPQYPQPILILESGSWLHDLTAEWNPGDGILAERLKEAGRAVVSS